jgi:hypothetical protein
MEHPCSHHAEARTGIALAAVQRKGELYVLSGIDGDPGPGYGINRVRDRKSVAIYNIATAKEWRLLR